MKFERLYEEAIEQPFKNGCGRRYRVGVTPAGGTWIVWLDGREPERLRGYLPETCDAFVRRGHWRVYTPSDNVKENTVNLNIDFASIIEKADKRRATLQEIQQELQMLPQMTRQLRVALGYFSNIAMLHNSLDHEGQEVAGKPVDLLRGVGYMAGNLLSHVSGDALDSGQRSLRRVFNELGLEWQE